MICHECDWGFCMSCYAQRRQAPEETPEVPQILMMLVGVWFNETLRCDVVVCAGSNSQELVFMGGTDFRSRTIRLETDGKFPRVSMLGEDGRPIRKVDGPRCSKDRV